MRCGCVEVDLFSDRVRSRTFTVLVLSFFIVHVFLYSELGQLSIVGRFFNAFPYALVAALILASNNPSANLLWQTFSLLIIIGINVLILLPSSFEVIAQVTLLSKVVSMLRLALLLLIDLHYIVATIRFLLGWENYIQQKESAYIEYSRHKMKEYKRVSAKRVFSSGSLKVQESQSPVFIPSVLIASCFSTFLLMLFTATSTFEYFQTVSTELEQGIADYDHIVTFTKNSERFISHSLNVLDSYQIDQSLKRLFQLTKHFEEQADLLLGSEFEENANLSKRLLQEFKPYLHDLEKYVDSMHNESRRLCLDASDHCHEKSFFKEALKRYAAVSTSILSSLEDGRLLLNSLYFSLKVSWKVALAFSFIIAVLIIPVSLLSYRRIILKLRNGKASRIQRNKSDVQKELDSVFDLRNSPFVVGVQFSSAYIGFYLVFVLVFSFFFFVSWERLWKYIELSSLPNIALQALVVFLCTNVVLIICLGRRLVSDSSRVKKPLIWSWYFVIALFAGFISGVLGAFVRFVSLLVISFFSMFRIDFTLFPKRLQAFDITYVTFMSFVLGQHRHDNPHIYAFFDCFKAEKPRESNFGFCRFLRSFRFRFNSEVHEILPTSEQRHDSFAQERKRRASNRWKLAYMLVLDPSLREHRRGTSMFAESPIEGQVQ
jgi:hypothetical protein